MSSEQNAPEVAEPHPYTIKIEDAGPATKKIAIEIPGEHIADKLAEQFKDLRKEATVPGFRPGHAPQKLVERRFASDVREQVRRNVISDSYHKAIEENKLQVLGEPEFESAEEVKLPDSGPLSYTFTVEVQPEFEIPDVSELTVKKTKIEVTDENVDQAMNNLREQQGTLLPVEDRGVEDNDYILADLHVKLDGENVIHQHDAQLVSRAGRIAGIQIDDFADKIRGTKSGATVSFKVTAPETHREEKIRNKEVEVELAIKDIRRLELAELNAEFLGSLGFESEAEVRDALREQLDERIQSDVQSAMRSQVHTFLLDNVQFELPTKLTSRQADRVVNRRGMDLLMRGIPREQVEQNLESLRAGADDEARRELKLFFVLQKVAEQNEVDVDEAELNGRIAMIAMQRGRRPEKVKQEMSQDGSLQNLYIQIREQKAVDKLLEKAKIEEVAPETKA